MSASASASGSGSDAIPARTILDCNCGTNSPAINEFFINGLHAGGCYNAEGYRLVPNTLTPAVTTCPRGATLGVSGEELVALGNTGEVIDGCRGRALLGATFDIEGHDREQSQVHVKIAAIKEVAKKTGTVLAYKFVDAGDPTGESLCLKAGASTIRSSLGLKPLNYDSFLDVTAITARPRAADVDAGGGDASSSSGVDDRDYAIAIAGELYTNKGDVLTREAGWFNLACVGGALAKAQLLGLAKDVEHRRAAIRMITADYCGDHHYTLAGVKIEMLDGELDGGPVPEALWDVDGASCLHLPRTKDACSGPMCRTRERTRAAIVQACGKRHPLPECDASYRAEGAAIWASFLAQ